MADITQSPPQAEALDALGQIERQVLWLSTAIIHHANRVRPNPAGMKVGGHQASSASMVSIMTSLWFGHLRAQDRVSVKPHASPVLHAINYLLGEVVWVVDVNRQSLDRVVPLIAADRLRGMFTAAGWQVITLKYGRMLEELFTRPGGDALRHRIDAMPNPEYQRLLRCDAAELRRRLPGGDSSIAALIAALDDAYNAIDDDRPTLILAYTIKGYGLPIEGHPQNHSALLTAEQIRELAVHLGADADHPWQRF